MPRNRQENKFTSIYNHKSFDEFYRYTRFANKSGVDDHVAKKSELTRFKCNQIRNYYKFYTSSVEFEVLKLHKLHNKCE